MNIRDILTGACVLLVACGGASDNGADAGAALPASTERSLLLEVPGPRSRPTDRDGDGLPDAIDPFPEQVAVRDTAASPVFDLQRVVTSLAGHSFPDLLHADLPATLQLVGLQRQSGPHYLVLDNGDGKDVIPIQPDADGVITLGERHLSLPVTAVYVLGARYRTRNIDVRWLPAGSPLMAPVSPAMQGGTLTVRGHGLQAGAFFLNGQALMVRAEQPGQVQLDIPADAVSGPLQIKQSGLGTDSQPLMLRRHVTIEPNVQPPLPLKWAQPGELRHFPEGSPADVVVPTTVPGLVRFGRADGNVSRLRLQTLIWPDETRASLDPERIVLATAYTNRRQLFPHWPEDWRDQRDGLLRLARTPEGQQAQERISAGLVEPESYDQAEVLAGLSSASRTIFQPEPHPAAGSKRFLTPFGKELFEQSVTARIGDQLYPRREISNLTIENENGALSCLGIETKPNGLRPSDICLENDSALIASMAASVDRGGGLAPARSHVPHQQLGALFHKDLVGGNFGGFLSLASIAFLTDDNGRTLCGQDYCEVELLTSSFNSQGTTLTSTQERSLVTQLQAQALVVHVLFPMLELLSDDTINVLDKDCVANGLVRHVVLRGVAGQAGNAVTLLEFLRKAEGGFSSLVSSNPAEGVSILAAAYSDTFAKSLTDLMLGKTVGTFKLLDCAIKEEGVVKQVTDEFADRFGKGKVNLLIIALDVWAKVLNFIELVTAPQKLTFLVEPIARVTDISDSIDLTKPQIGEGEDAVDNGFFIDGFNIGAPPENENAFVPRIRMTDSADQQIELAPAVYRQTRTDGNKGQLVVEVNAMLEAGAEDLRPGPVKVELVVDGYPEFDNDELLIPAGSIEMLGRPQPTSVDPAQTRKVNADVPLLIRGYRLDAAPPEAIKAILSASGQAPIEVSLTANDAFVDTEQENPALATSLAVSLPPAVFELGSDPFRLYGVQLEFPPPVGRRATQNNLLVVSDDLAFATLADSGFKADDTMTLRLIDSLGNVAIGPNDGRTVDAQAPVPFKNVYSNTLYWDHLNLDVAEVEIECVDGGDDGVCTYSLELTQFRSAGAAPEAFAGKILSGKTADRIPFVCDLPACPI